MLPLSAAHADGVTVRDVHLENSEEGYRLSAAYDLELNRGLEDALARGIPLYFTTEVEIIRPRWLWFDSKEVSRTQTVRISYNVLTRQYYAAMTGRIHQSFTSLDDALSMVRRPNRWLVADQNTLKPGETYEVAVRMQLDVAQLPKPFQVHAMNSSDWRLSSDWQRFTFKAE
ncbi:DUF4390 domain-containing protein [uncultured Oxalicibacterium sp.]|uniref:DUF4390 domain-containing protein n=1 Tax=uncultured Oxalicibacterium sp. TaxID=1168540 RepID=UPI0025CF5987|nr:DUF4390 domain-containing protein [uncultured Oxalicibacterium sp.]